MSIKDKIASAFSGTFVSDIGQQVASSAVRNAYNLPKEVSQATLDYYRNTYGLSDDDMKLLLPMLQSGSSPNDILAYIQKLIATHQDNSYNEGASAREIQNLRSIGYNPDLSGSMPSGNSSVGTPSGVFDISDLPSNGGKGSLSGKFTDVAGMLLKTMSFGLQAYGLVSGNLTATASLLSGFADADVLNTVADENGVVTNVDGAIADLIRSRGLSGRKAKLYANYVSGRINSVGSITGRLRQASDKALALYDSKINGYKASDDYTNNIIACLRDTSSMQAKQAEYDLKIQKCKAEWLEDHPDYPAEQLELDLAGKRADTSVKQASASEAWSKANIAKENLEQEKSNTEAVKGENDVRKLKSDLVKIELEGIDEMIKFCQEYEDYMSDVPRWLWFSDGTDRGVKYRNYKKQIKNYYDKGKSAGKASVSVPGLGSIGFNI